MKYFNFDLNKELDFYAYRETSNHGGKMKHSEMHTFWEIYFCLSHASQVMHINGHEFSSNQPCIAINAPFSVHDMNVYDCTDYDRYVIYFRKTFFQKAQLDIRHYGNTVFLLNDAQAKELQCWLSLIDCHGERNVFARKESKRLSHTECVSMMNGFFATLDRLKPEKMSFPYSPENSYVADVLKYIYENLSGDLNAISIAKKFNISRSKLDRDVKNYCGQNLHELVVRVRLNYALDMLRNTDYPISKLAEICGLNNEIYFYSFIKKHMGKNPSSFRQSSKERKV
jgi:AraC-like DNA-binding protein